MEVIDQPNTLLMAAFSLGPIASFAMMNQSKAVVLEYCEHYQKRSFRNRYKINSTNGYQTLSIPLAKGKNNKQSISDVKISYDENWVGTHLQTIKSAYGRSPYFEYYYDEIALILLKKHLYLWDFNFAFLQYFIRKLKLDIDIELTSTYHHKYNLLNDVRTYTHWGNHNLMSYAPVWQHQENTPSDISVLDLLFCTGPEAKGHLESPIIKLAL